MEKAWITNYKRYRRSVAQTDAQGYPQEDRQLPDIDKENRVFRITVLRLTDSCCGCLKTP